MGRNPFDSFFDSLDEIVDGAEKILKEEKPDEESQEIQENSNSQGERSNGVPRPGDRRSDDDTPPARPARIPSEVKKVHKIIDID